MNPALRSLLLPALLLLTSLPAPAATATRGGQGGRILKVTSLEGTGRGTLREALWAKGPRIIVFEVGGVIDLQGKSLTVSEPFVTLAGQTAPSPGITLIHGGLRVNTHDAIIQHLRIRPGEAGRAKKSGWIIHSEQEVGGYPRPQATSAPFKAEEWNLTTMERR